MWHWYTLQMHLWLLNFYPLVIIAFHSACKALSVYVGKKVQHLRQDAPIWKKRVGEEGAGKPRIKVECYLSEDMYLQSSGGKSIVNWVDD